MLIAHESEGAAQASAQLLKRMGAVPRKVLAECVEHQGIRRTKASKAANQLEDAGFIFIKEVGDMWAPAVTLSPSLLGEEALETLENMESKEQ